jgi:GNAT superfamily N-acetyltransferase
MWWRCKRREFESQSGAGNRMAMKALVDKGVIPGILAYIDHRPIGWCSVSPRIQYGSLERSHVLKRIDDEPVWSIVCFFVAKDYRRYGLMRLLIDAAVAHAASCGAKIVEAYPTVPRGRTLAPASSFMGIPEIFFKCGFKLVGEPSISRIVPWHNSQAQEK